MMKKNIKNILTLFLLVAFFLLFGKIALAQGLVPCGLNGAADCTLCHLVVGFKNILDYLLYTVLFPLFMLGITISGILYMVSSGNKSLIEWAKKALMASLAGFVIALTSWIMVNFVMLTLGFQSPLGGSWWQFTCDTTQTTGPGTTGPGGATLPGGSGGGGGISGKGRDINVPQDGSKLAQNLEKYKGAIYEWGKDYYDSNGVYHTDCSGFMQLIYKETYGVNIPRYSGDQGNIAFNQSSLVNGTILESSGHVGIYYNGSVYHNSQTGSDIRVVELNQYLSNRKVYEMRLPPS